MDNHMEKARFIRTTVHGNSDMWLLSRVKTMATFLFFAGTPVMATPVNNRLATDRAA
jgi:hypothetical protein